MNTKIKDPMAGAFHHREYEADHDRDTTIYETSIRLAVSSAITNTEITYSSIDPVLMRAAERERTIRDHLYGDLFRRYREISQRWYPEVQNLQRDFRIHKTTSLRFDLARAEEALKSRLSDFEDALRICMEGSNDG